MRLRTALPSVAVLACAAAVTVAPAGAAIVGITGLTLSNGDPATVTAEPTNVLSFTTANGTVSTLSGSASTVGGSATSLRAAGAAEDTSGITAADLDVSRGLANVNTGANVFDVQFGQTLTGAAGAGNDIFLIELGNSGGLTTAGGDDALTVFALDASGAVVGSPLAIASGDFGNTQKQGTFTTNGTNSLTRILAGLAIDVEDFGAVSGGISGIRLGGIAGAVGNGIDPLAIGFNTAAVAAAPVPEPTAGLVVLGGLVATAVRRPRKRA